MPIDRANEVCARGVRIMLIRISHDIDNDFLGRIRRIFQQRTGIVDQAKVDNALTIIARAVEQAISGRDIGATEVIGGTDAWFSASYLNLVACCDLFTIEDNLSVTRSSDANCARIGLKLKDCCLRIIDQTLSKAVGDD